MIMMMMLLLLMVLIGLIVLISLIVLSRLSSESRYVLGDLDNLAPSRAAVVVWLLQMIIICNLHNTWEVCQVGLKAQKAQSHRGKQVCSLLTETSHRKFRYASSDSREILHLIAECPTTPSAFQK